MTDVDKAQNYEFHPSISAEEREFYLKAYPTPDNVRDRRTHCTTCKMHLGTAPANAENIKMHPILRVTHCPKCQDFYNCGEFSKGEDGSELYCRWCGQGGEVYCCSNCPFVFCKSCITKNLSRGVVADIEQNENWRCFACAPKILWPLRAVHWALTNYIEKQKKEIEAMNLTEEEKIQELAKDRSNCCRLAKAKCGNMSDSMDSIDSALSKRSQGSTPATKKKLSTPSPQTPAPKRPKTGNSEVVCTPDLLSMLEPDCQLTVTPKPKQLQTRPITPKVVQVQSSYTPPPVRSLPPPPLIQLRSPSVQVRPVSSNAQSNIIRRTVVSPRTPSPAGSQSPVYHTINGYRIDLNSAAQQGTYRLPNGKLIQVKRQSAPMVNNQAPVPTAVSNWQHRTPVQSPVQRLQISPAVTQPRSFVTVQQQLPTPAQPIRYPSGVVGSTVISSFNQNGPQIQMVNGGVNVVNNAAQPAATGQPVQIRPVMVRHTFPNNAYGAARTRFQDQIFNAMEICQHLTGKIQTLTNSNAYKTAKNYLELKELYIHMSYLLTYAIGRFKGLQDKCLGDMRQLGFGTDADSLENGQLAAGVDYVRYGQLEDVELFTANMNSFHNQIYEYRKSLLANMEHVEDRPPLSPLHDLNGLNDDDDLYKQSETNAEQRQNKTGGWHKTSNYEEDDDDVQEVTMDDDSSTFYKGNYRDDDGPDFDDTIENEYYGGVEGGSGVGGGYGTQRSTEDVMRREEESHAYDRKLTRLIQQYPSIWCTRHPDYGNFEVTRKQWRTIASHFTYSADMKMRWKNIRKRYVRIERRMHEGKRFNGYFDKATNFLINRDRPMNDWIQVDCGTDDGDNYERQKLDQIEKELHGGNSGASQARANRQSIQEDYEEPLDNVDSEKPVEIKPLDMKIIHFVKCNPVLWRKSSDSQFHKMDEQTRKSLWMHLWKSVPYVRCSDLVERWTQLYEMYKTFRLKTIKSERALAALELKYSKYLAKLYFLYKIDEEELINEDKALIFGDPFDDESDEQTNATAKVIDKPDDKEFLLALVRAVRHYPSIWDENNPDFHDMLLRDESWEEIAGILEKFGHKQASDNEDDEIEIVEPKTDTINLDSDDEETTPTSNASKVQQTSNKLQIHKINIPAKIRPVQQVVNPSQVTTSEPDQMLVPMGSQQEDDNQDDMGDFMSAAHSLLASMLEVDIIEGDTEINPNGKPKKQPRKKTTNKPNPTLLKQKRMLERQKMEELKRNDTKLKMKCLVEAVKVDKEYPNFQEKLEDLERRRREWREEQARIAKAAEEAKRVREAEEAAAAEKQREIESSITAAVGLAAVKVVEAPKKDVSDDEASKKQLDAEVNGSLKADDVCSLAKTTVEVSAGGDVSMKEATVDEKVDENKSTTETTKEKMETDAEVMAAEEKVEEKHSETVDEKLAGIRDAAEVEKTVELEDNQPEENKRPENGVEEVATDNKDEASETIDKQKGDAKNETELEAQKISTENEQNNEVVSNEKTDKNLKTNDENETNVEESEAIELNEDETAATNVGGKTEAEETQVQQEKSPAVAVEEAETTSTNVDSKAEAKETQVQQEESLAVAEEDDITAAATNVDSGNDAVKILIQEKRSPTIATNEVVDDKTNLNEDNQMDADKEVQAENANKESAGQQIETEDKDVEETSGIDDVEMQSLEPSKDLSNESAINEINAVNTPDKVELEEVSSATAEEAPAEAMQVDADESILETENPTQVSSTLETAAPLPIVNTDNEFLAEIEKVLAANIESDAQSTLGLPTELDASEIDALKPLSSIHTSKETVETCLGLEAADDDNVPASTTAIENNTALNNVFEELCGKININPSTLDLPIAQSNELQTDSNATTTTTTAQNDDVEMATLPIEKDILSNNQ